MTLVAEPTSDTSTPQGQLIAESNLRPRVRRGDRVRVLEIHPTNLLRREYFGDDLTAEVRTPSESEDVGAQIGVYAANAGRTYTIDAWKVVSRADGSDPALELPPPARPEVKVGQWVRILRLYGNDYNLDNPFHVGDGTGKVKALYDPTRIVVTVRPDIDGESESDAGEMSVYATEWEIIDTPVRQRPEVALGTTVRVLASRSQAKMSDGTFGEDGTAMVVGLPTPNRNRLRVEATSTAGKTAVHLIEEWEVVRVPSKEELADILPKIFYRTSKRYAAAHGMCGVWTEAMKELGLWPTRPVTVTFTVDVEDFDGDVDFDRIRNQISGLREVPNFAVADVERS